jgi:hypothetical protein
MVIGAGGLIRSGIANDRATPTSAGGPVGYILGIFWPGMKKCCVGS